MTYFSVYFLVLELIMAEDVAGKTGMTGCTCHPHLLHMHCSKYTFAQVSDLCQDLGVRAFLKPLHKGKVLTLYYY